MMVVTNKYFDNHNNFDTSATLVGCKVDNVVMLLLSFQISKIIFKYNCVKNNLQRIYSTDHMSILEFDW